MICVPAEGVQDVPKKRVAAVTDLEFARLWFFGTGAVVDVLVSC